jgi:hypothetical protein
MTNAVQYEINQYFDVCLHNSVFYNNVDHVKSSMLTYCFWPWRHAIRTACIKIPNVSSTGQAVSITTAAPTLPTSGCNHTTPAPTPAPATQVIAEVQ